MPVNPNTTKVRDLIPLPSVPWEATTDQPAYVAKLWLEAGRRRREAGRLESIILETLAEAERIEALARTLEGEMAMADPQTTEPCKQPDRYDRGECGYPHCGCFDKPTQTTAPDLVAELRAWASPGCDYSPEPKLLTDAAAEIERLRAAMTKALNFVQNDNLSYAAELLDGALNHGE